MSGLNRKIKVLIVDDSVVYRTQIRNGISALDFCEVVAVASNGKMALDRLSQGSVDLIVLDLEMPEMNGLQTLHEMARRGYGGKVLLFSSHSKRGAEITMEALRAGASDFLPKPGSQPGSVDIAVDPAKQIQDLVRPKIEALFALNQSSLVSLPEVPLLKRRENSIGLPENKVFESTVNWKAFSPSAVVIGSSTGGPTALEKIFSNLSAPLNVPVFIAQHMPPIFTATLAERLKKLLGIEVHEGRDGELVQANHIYVAPGDYHMTVKSTQAGAAIVLDQRPLENFVRPAVDPLFRTAAEVFGNGLLAIILTGMGSDGKNGCFAVKQAGGVVAIQDKESCVVFGMPGAVHSTGAYDKMGDTTYLAGLLREKICLHTATVKGG